MATFSPLPGDNIIIGEKNFSTMSHPVVPSMTFGQEGRKATVYQLKNNGNLFALKVFKPMYRQPSLFRTCQSLSKITLPGLEVCNRLCLTTATHRSLLTKYPELEYAVLMPWVQGTTWFDMIASESALSLDDGKLLAKNTALTLYRLEQLGLAHCDIAGPNVIINPSAGQVSIIDVEDMFGPFFKKENGYPSGTSGYQHRVVQTLTKGQWQAEGDRFAAAILIAEILAWHKINIRQAAEAEHFFDNDELQNPRSPRFSLILEILSGLSPKLADCFHRAWHSRSLVDCPSLKEWYTHLKELPVRKWAPIEALPSPYSNLPQGELANYGLEVIGSRPEPWKSRKKLDEKRVEDIVSHLPNSRKNSPTIKQTKLTKTAPTLTIGNTSGSGKKAVVPAEIKGKWNWGAFLLSLLWGISHNTWIVFFVFLPYVGFLMFFVLGFKGNEWAWKNKKWNSIEHFQSTQRKWRNWGFGLLFVFFIMFACLLVTSG